MTRYAVFLRGVNVGGVNLKMAEVARSLDGVGFANVRTILASGNVLLDSHQDVASVRAKAEAALRETFGYDAWVLAYDLPALRAIVSGYPFQSEAPGHHSYVTFVSDAAMMQELAKLSPQPGERIAPGPGAIYWQVPRSATLTSTIGKTMGKKRYKSSTTTRNLRTLEKVLR